MAHFSRLIALGLLFAVGTASAYELNWTGTEAGGTGSICAQAQVTSNSAYSTEYGSLWFDTPEAAAAHYAEWYSAAPSSYNYTIGTPTRNSNTTNLGAGTHTATTTYCSKANPASCGSLSATTFRSRVAPNAAVSCPPPVPECGNPGDGYSRNIRALNVTAARSVIGTCYDGCTVTDARATGPGMDKDGAGTFNFLFFVETGAGTCSGGGGDPTPPETPAVEPSGEVCVTSAAGVEYCNGPYGENCGYVNGKYTCLGKTDSDECFVHTDGGRLCGESAPVPPVPDNGTPGVRATPTDTVSQQSGATAGTTYNYYNSTVVAGSARDPGTSGANPNRPNSTDPATGSGGTGEYPEPPTGEASGGETCAAAPTCTHDDPVQCAQLMQQWRARCTDVTSEEALAAIGATEAEIAGDLSAGIDPIDMGEWSADGQMVGGACPAPVSITIMGQTLSMDIWQRGCDMALLFAPFVLAMGYFAGAMLLMRGGI